MKKITFGTPEELVPSTFCKGFNYAETDVKFDVSSISFKTTARGCVLEFPLLEEEQLYGFGLHLKKFNQKNQKLQLTPSASGREPGYSHAPVPFFVSTKGYGMYFDTARNLCATCGFGRNKDREPAPDNTIVLSNEDFFRKTDLHETTYMTVEIPAAKGIDVYIFEGENIVDIVSQYNMLSGGGCEVPEWSLGILYRAFAKNTDKEVMELAKYFREHDIPCDILGLEPGWQSNSYSCSYVWDPERYGNYKEMVKYLLDNGFHINLWEHAYVNATAPIYKDLHDLSCDYDILKGLVPDFAMEEAQKIFADYHKKYLVDMGIDGFKLDECDDAGWNFPYCAEFPSGLDGEQYHQLFGVLYMQTIMKALDGKTTLSQVRNAGALSAGYPFVLYSDEYDHKDFIRAMLNSGFTGLLWTPELRHGDSKKDLLRRLQTTVFSVQCLINAWYCPEMPWKKFDCEEEVKELLNVRKSLVPMLKEAFDKYHTTGRPPVRALVSDYTSDKETYTIDDQYIFCDKLIVAPLTAKSDTRKVYLPEGTWRDYWTKEPVASGWFEVTTENIPVYEKC
ncbi:MAG: hypothetical protein E7658_01355 [Ruminococcaceae bacterium]|nr:hypothetical protein [Oscillospiraceae bacterium]